MTIGQSKEEMIAFLLREDEARYVHRMVQDFSTWEPFALTLRKQLNLIGFFFKTCLGAEKAIHFFTNPEIGRVDWMFIGENEKDIREYQQEREIIVLPMELIQEIADNNNSDIVKLCEKSLGIGKYYFIPFSQHDTPFGQFILLFGEHVPTKTISEKIRGTANILQYRLKDLLYNHYPITSFTYLPSFQNPPKKPVEAAILFCDIRDSTSMFEIARMTNDNLYTEMLISLLKSFLEYASRIISVSNTGWIHRFLGDGFVATFGEYLTLNPSDKAKAACALSLLTANLLQTGFDRLWAIARNHLMEIGFLGIYNEDLDLRLGIGVNYGSVRFDVFGITIEEARNHQIPRGHSEFTAVGDHMSFAHRLCSVANQPLSAVNFVYRSEERPSRLTAPIIASRTVTYWSRACFKTPKDVNPLDIFRTDFQLKGKGHPMPGFEIWPDTLNVDLLLNCVKGIHKNQFYEVIADENNKHAELESVSNRFASTIKDLIDEKR